ncbi:MAG: hypothetical protein KBF93_19020 [Leptospiraceae bacterium]|nr:hypothetical protein [Leptospiraceae bacterium]
MVSKFLDFLLFPFKIFLGLLTRMLVSMLENYLPHLCLLLSLFAILVLILIDPLTSYYAYLKTGNTENIKAVVNFSSKESYSAALDVLWTMAFIYLVKTDGRFIDKFIELLKLLKSNVSKVQSSVSKKINKLAGKK